EADAACAAGAGSAAGAGLLFSAGAEDAGASASLAASGSDAASSGSASTSEDAAEAAASLEAEVLPASLGAADAAACTEEAGASALAVVWLQAVPIRAHAAQRTKAVHCTKNRFILSNPFFSVSIFRRGRSSCSPSGKRYSAASSATVQDCHTPWQDTASSSGWPAAAAGR